MNAIEKAIEKGKDYLISQIEDGVCSSFGQFRRGPSMARTSACIGSTLSEVGEVREDILQKLLSLQHSSGGRSYNDFASPDADSTLRVLQFFNKIGFTDKKITSAAINYIYNHQDTDGGIKTYTNQELLTMGRPERVRYAMPHLDVSALACNVLPESEQKSKLNQYISQEINKTQNSYWWRTKYYVAYETGSVCEEQPDDSISLGLHILLDAKVKRVVTDKELATILALQDCDGSFPSSKQLQLPRPITPHDINSKEVIELIQDTNKIFSTAAIIVGLKRQNDLKKT